MHVSSQLNQQRAITRHVLGRANITIRQTWLNTRQSAGEHTNGKSCKAVIMSRDAHQPGDLFPQRGYCFAGSTMLVAVSGSRAKLKTLSVDTLSRFLDPGDCTATGLLAHERVIYIPCRASS